MSLSGGVSLAVCIGDLILGGLMLARSDLKYSARATKALKFSNLSAAEEGTHCVSGAQYISAQL